MKNAKCKMMTKFIDRTESGLESDNMGKKNAVLEKSYDFSVHVVLFCKILIEERREYVISKQLMKSGTSIGANVEEAQRAQSKKDFISKMSISLKEAQESHYWLRLIRDTNYATADAIKPLLVEVEELIALLTSIIKSTKQNLNDES
jgi:four helix bundle protein